MKYKVGDLAVDKDGEVIKIVGTTMTTRVSADGPHPPAFRGRWEQMVYLGQPLTSKFVWHYDEDELRPYNE